MKKVLTFTSRSVRERFKNMREKTIKKRNSEEKASGIIGEHDDLDDSLEELDILFKEADQERDLMLEDKKNKAEIDRKKAIEMRRQSMETFSETKKRCSEDNDGQMPSSSKRTKNVFEYLKEKKDGERELKEADLKLRERELAIREKEAANVSSQQQQQQQQTQQLLQMLILQQQQQQQQQQQKQQNEMWMAYFRGNEKQ